MLLDLWPNFIDDEDATPTDPGDDFVHELIRDRRVTLEIGGPRERKGPAGQPIPQWFRR